MTTAPHKGVILRRPSGLARDEAELLGYSVPSRAWDGGQNAELDNEESDVPYWGTGLVDNDYGFDAISMYVFMIKERMFQDADNVIEKSYPEQGIITSLKCLRLLATEFPECVKVHFRRKDFGRAKDSFRKWFEATEKQLPKDYRDSIRSHAEEEFELFETQVL